MPSNRTPERRSSSQGSFWDILTFDRLLTGPVVHLIYWAGLGVIVLVGFFIVGAAVGTALREQGIWAALLAIPVVVAGALVFGAMVLLWRAFCEFYVVVFRISDDIRAFREANLGAPPEPPPSGKPLY